MLSSLIRRVIQFLTIAALSVCAFSQTSPTYIGGSGWCHLGGQSVFTQGMASSGTQPLSGSPFAKGAGVMASYPKCTITVYPTGGGTPANIFSSSSGASLSNPFTANTDGSFQFFVLAGCYDITESSGITSGSTMPTSHTDSDICYGTGGATTAACPTNVFGALSYATGAGVLVCDNTLTTDGAGNAFGLSFNSIAPWNGDSAITALNIPSPKALPASTFAWTAPNVIGTSMRNVVPSQPCNVGQAFQVGSQTTDATNTLNVNWNCANTFNVSGVAKGSALVSNGLNVFPVYQLKPVYDARDYGCAENGSTDDTTCINAMLTAASTNDSTFLFNGVSLMNSAIVFPTNVALQFSQGGGLKPATSVTTTIKGGIIATPNQQIFFNANSGTTGTIDFTGNPVIKEVYPEWWGAIASGGTQTGNTVAIQNAVYGAFGCGPVIACRTNANQNFKWNKVLKLQGNYQINGQINFYHVISFKVDCSGRDHAGMTQNTVNTEIIEGQSVAYGEFDNCSWSTATGVTQDVSHPLISLDFSGAQGADLATQFITFNQNNWSGTSSAAKIGMQLSRSGASAQGSNIHFYNNEIEQFGEAGIMIGVGASGSCSTLATNAVEVTVLGGDFQFDNAYGIEDCGGGQIRVDGTTFEDGFGAQTNTGAQTGYDVFCQSLPAGESCYAKDVRSESLFMFGGSAPWVAYNSFSVDQAYTPFSGNTVNTNDIIQGDFISGHGQYFQATAGGTFSGLLTHSASGGSATTLIDSVGGFTVNAWVGWDVVIQSGTGADAYCVVTSNTASTFTCSAGWVTDFVGISTSFSPDATTRYFVGPNWGTQTTSGTVTWAALNRFEFGGLCNLHGGFFPGVTLNCGVSQFSVVRDVQVTFVHAVASGNAAGMENFNNWMLYDNVMAGVPAGGQGNGAGNINGTAFIRNQAWARGTITTGMSSGVRDDRGTVPIFWAFGNPSGPQSISDVGIDTDAPGTTQKTGRLRFRNNSTGTEFDVWVNPDGSVQTQAKQFSKLTSCTSTNEGSEAAVTDSTTSTYGQSIAGSGANHVHAYCNGTNWIVD